MVLFFIKMPTIKPRIQVTIHDNELLEFISQVASTRNISKSRLSEEMLQTAREVIEDQYFGKISTDRLKKEDDLISHDKAWS